MKVIAGRFRGRPLRAPAGQTTRPTAARVREALFGILGDITGARVLDVCAGSGALGIEALSRGAAHATFVDPDRAALAAIKHNLSALKLSEEAAVLPLFIARASAALNRHGPFDLVLCDPPWPSADLVAGQLAPLLRGPLLDPHAEVVIGHRADRPIHLPPGACLALRERRAWGDSGLSFFELEPAAAGPFNAGSEGSTVEGSTEGSTVEGHPAAPPGDPN